LFRALRVYLVITNDYTDNLGNPLRGRASLFIKHIAKAMGLGEQKVYYGLVMAFGLLFVLPSLGFINFAFKYDFFADRDITYYFLSILIFSYLGFFILRSPRFRKTPAKNRRAS